MSSAPVPARSPRRKYFATVVLLSIALSAGLYVPADRMARSASVLLRISNPHPDGWLSAYKTNEVRVQPIEIAAGESRIPARLYVPLGIERPAAMVVVPGVHRLGYDEPRLQNFSNALASHGILVLTPQVQDFADYKVTPQAQAVVTAAVEDLYNRTGHKVGLLGLSFAGGTSLLAAADPAVSDKVGFVVAIGSHHDLSRVLKFFATDELPLPDGSVQRMKAHEYGPLIVVYSHPEEFFSPEDVERARSALRHLLWEDRARAEAEAAQLSPAGQRFMQKLFEHNTKDVAPILLAGIDRYKYKIDSASPRGHLQTLRAPVFLLHGAADNVVPPGELLWLAKEVPPQQLKGQLISPVVSHVELGKNPSARDYYLLVEWFADVLGEADRSAR